MKGPWKPPRLRSHPQRLLPLLCPISVSGLLYCEPPGLWGQATQVRRCRWPKVTALGSHMPRRRLLSLPQEHSVHPASEHSSRSSVCGFSARARLQGGPSACSQQVPAPESQSISTVTPGPQKVTKASMSDLPRPPPASLPISLGAPVHLSSYPGLKIGFLELARQYRMTPPQTT